MPIRIQRKRTKGWKMPEGAVYVGRPTKWGNLWRVRRGDAPSCATTILGWYRDWLLHRLKGWEMVETPDLEPLRGKDLVCWCRLDQPCHADVLLELANAEPPSGEEATR